MSFNEKMNPRKKNLKMPTKAKASAQSTRKYRNADYSEKSGATSKGELSEKIKIATDNERDISTVFGKVRDAEKMETVKKNDPTAKRSESPAMVGTSKKTENPLKQKDFQKSEMDNEPKFFDQPIKYNEKPRFNEKPKLKPNMSEKPKTNEKPKSAVNPKPSENSSKPSKIPKLVPKPKVSEKLKVYEKPESSRKTKDTERDIKGNTINLKNTGAKLAKQDIMLKPNDDVLNEVTLVDLPNSRDISCEASKIIQSIRSFRIDSVTIPLDKVSTKDSKNTQPDKNVSEKYEVIREHSEIVFNTSHLQIWDKALKINDSVDNRDTVTKKRGNFDAKTNRTKENIDLKTVQRKGNNDNKIDQNQIYNDTKTDQIKGNIVTKMDQNKDYTDNKTVQNNFNIDNKIDQNNILTKIDQNNDIIDTKTDMNKHYTSMKIDQNKEHIATKIDQPKGTIDNKIDQSKGNIDTKTDQNNGNIDTNIDQNKGNVDTKTDPNKAYSNFDKSTNEKDAPPSGKGVMNVATDLILNHESYYALNDSLSFAIGHSNEILRDEIYISTLNFNETGNETDEDVFMLPNKLTGQNENAYYVLTIDIFTQTEPGNLSDKDGTSADMFKMGSDCVVTEILNEKDTYSYYVLAIDRSTEAKSDDLPVSNIFTESIPKNNSSSYMSTKERYTQVEFDYTLGGDTITYLDNVGTEAAQNNNTIENISNADYTDKLIQTEWDATLESSDLNVIYLNNVGTESVLTSRNTSTDFQNEEDSTMKRISSRLESEADKMKERSSYYLAVDRPTEQRSSYYLAIDRPTSVESNDLTEVKNVPSPCNGTDDRKINAILGNIGTEIALLPPMQLCNIYDNLPLILPEINTTHMNNSRTKFPNNMNIINVKQEIPTKEKNSTKLHPNISCEIEVKSISLDETSTEELNSIPVHDADISNVGTKKNTKNDSLAITKWDKNLKMLSLDKRIDNRTIFNSIDINNLKKSSIVLLVDRSTKMVSKNSFVINGIKMPYPEIFPKIKDDMFKIETSSLGYTMSIGRFLMKPEKSALVQTTQSTQFSVMIPGPNQIAQMTEARLIKRDISIGEAKLSVPIGTQFDIIQIMNTAETTANIAVVQQSVEITAYRFSNLKLTQSVKSCQIEFPIAPHKTIHEILSQQDKCTSNKSREKVLSVRFKEISKNPEGECFVIYKPKVSKMGPTGVICSPIPKVPVFNAQIIHLKADCSIPRTDRNPANRESYIKNSMLCHKFQVLDV